MLVRAGVYAAIAGSQPACGRGAKSPVVDTTVVSSDTCNLVVVIASRRTTPCSGGKPTSSDGRVPPCGDARALPSGCPLCCSEDQELRLPVGWVVDPFGARWEQPVES